MVEFPAVRTLQGRGGLRISLSGEGLPIFALLILVLCLPTASSGWVASAGAFCLVLTVLNSKASLVLSLQCLQDAFGLAVSSLGAA